MLDLMLNYLAVKRYEQVAARWIKSYLKDGILGLRDTHKEKSGSSSDKALTNEEFIAKQNTQLQLLEEQIKLIKKSNDK